jgi:integrase
MTGRLTDSKVLGIKAPARGQVEHSDSDVPGLRIRVGSSGAKTFILRKRAAGRLHNITLGRYGPRFGVAEARRKARALISDLEAGKAPPAKRSRGDVLTVRALLPAYLDSKAELRSADDIGRILRRYVLPELGDRLADAVTRGDVTRLVDGIAESAPAMARAVHAQLSAFYTWAMPRLDRLSVNPCRDAGRPGPAKARDRVLSDDELVALWRAAEKESVPWGPGLQLLMLTGARRDEVFWADRAEFDLRAKEWTIPAARSKNGLPNIVPLTPAAVRVIKRIPASAASGKLFPSRRKASSEANGASGYSKAQARYRLALPTAEHWTLHDIRRTVATGLQRLGVRFEVTEAVLNHVSGARGGIAGVYQRHDWKIEKCHALNLWTRHVLKIVRAKS